MTSTVLFQYLELVAICMCVVFDILGCQACSGVTCGQCIAFKEDCAWCADVNFTTQAVDRCGLFRILKENGCQEIHSPKTEEVLSKRNDTAVTDGISGQGDDAIQLQPQVMYIKVRPNGKGHGFTVTFRPANNFPVDLYFLFDVSATMKTSITDLSKLAIKMAEEIRSISTNYRMGYGTFQDKVLLPFTNTHPQKLLSPYTGSSPAFAFHHVLNLTNDLPSFTNAVNSSKITGNIDRPEGGLDAVMQAIVCEKVGWRNRSRQLIVFASDARMHFAGDGKLAGIISPNDGLCHLDDGQNNSMAGTQDYPSLGQIASALDRTKKHVIFAVKDKVMKEYLILQSHVSRSSVNVLQSGSNSNVVNIVRDKYKELTQGVKLESSATSSNIRVTIKPLCEKHDGETCQDLQIGDPIYFKVNIIAEKCPSDPAERFQTVTIAPSDFLQDKLTVTVEITCDCDCQQDKTNVTLVPDEICSHGNGTLECGICHCAPGRTGSFCECGQQDLVTSSTSTCSAGGNGTFVPECSGIGDCICGVCNCPSGYSGKFCQCNDYACPIANGRICAGNGGCDCGKCQCERDFTGHACECSLSTVGCFPDNKSFDSTEVCSGHGSCECGSCICQDGYGGKLCDKCYLCGDQFCDVDNYRECVRCKTCKDFPEHCPNDCPPDWPPDCPPLEMVPRVDGDDFYSCHERLPNECFLRFKVLNPGQNNTKIQIQEQAVCPQEVDVALVIGGVIGGIVAVGLLLLLLWKILTLLFDKMEYARFEKELNTHKWAKQLNPLYKEATTTYYNPTLDTKPDDIYEK